MLARQRIFICGQSIFMRAIEANLAARPDVELHRFDAELPHITDRLMKQNPALVILEQYEKPNNVALNLMRHNQPLLMLDTQKGKVITFTGQIIRVIEMSALVHHQD